MILDIQIKIVLPSVQSRINLTGLIDFLSGISDDADFQNSFQVEAVFRFKTDPSIVQGSSRSFVSWIPTFNFGPNSQDGEPLLDASKNPTQSQNDSSIQAVENTQSNLAAHRIQDETFVTQPQWVRDSVMKIAKSDMQLCESGVGGTYFINSTDSQSRISVFKPIDEEPGSPNNPKKNPPSFIPMMEWGRGAHREVAAYKLDKGFVGVPETHFVEVIADGVVKTGSLQQFIDNDGDCSDIGASKFSVDDIHRLGIFDIRILNMDRNDENLLVKKTSKKEWKLVPIDHTYAFPNKIDSYFNWQFWNQTKKSFSSESLDYISSIDVLSDAHMLLQTGIDEESVRNVTGSTLLLQKAALRGYNLFQIAAMVSGSSNDLVKILSKARDQEGAGAQNTQQERFCMFKTTMQMLIDEHLDTQASK